MLNLSKGGSILKKFVYDEISRRETLTDIEYTCVGEREYSLIEILDKIGDEGWELVGEINGRLIVKREY